MCFRKAADVVPLLQGLAEVQIVSHSRFAAKMDFNTSHLGIVSTFAWIRRCTQPLAIDENIVEVGDINAHHGIATADGHHRPATRDHRFVQYDFKIFGLGIRV